MEITIQGKIEIKASEFYTNDMNQLLKYWLVLHLKIVPDLKKKSKSVHSRALKDNKPKS